MLSYLARRLAWAFVTFFGIVTIVFLIVHAVPGDPITYFAVGADRTVSPERLDRLRSQHHLDRPLLVQYGYWLRDAARLDFGRSFADQRPVSERIAEKLPNTFMLNFIALVVALGVAIPIGLLTVSAGSRWVERGSGVLLTLLYSLPNFWVALLLIEIVAVRLGILPLYGMTSDGYEDMSAMQRIGDRLQHLVLPVATLAYTQLALFARFATASLDEVIGKEFIVAARARGVGRGGILFRHAFRNALIPLIGLLGLSIPLLLSGSVIVERIFQWDGIGHLYLESLLARDYPTVMGLTVITALVTLAASVVTDLLYLLVDPRIRLEEGRR